MAQTLGQHLLNDIIPEDMRDDSRVFNKKGSRRFFQELAEKHPESYSKVLKGLMDISRVAGTEQGGLASVRLQDLRLPEKVKEYRNKIKGHITAIQQDPRSTAEQKNASIVGLMRKEMPKIQEMVNASTSGGDNALGESIKHGFRGNPVQLTQLLFGDMLVADQKGAAIPVPGLNGYGEGVTPMQYFAGAFGSRKGYCLLEGTEVRMADGTIRAIEDINVGDYVLGADKTGSTSPVEVKALYDNGIQEVYEYLFRSGRSNNIKTISATESHEVLASWTTGASSRKELIKRPLGVAKQNFGIQPAKGNSFEGKPCSKAKAFLLGYLIGDGFLSEKNSIEVYSADTLVIDSMNAMFKAEDIPWVLEYKDKTDAVYNRTSVTYILKETIRKNRFARSEVKDWLRSLGVLGKRAWEKTVPSEVFNWDAEAIGHFLNGYFEADGGYSLSGSGTTTPYVGFTSTSRNLLEQVEELLATRMGIYCSAIKVRRKEDIQDSYPDGQRVTARRDCYSLRYGNREGVLQRSSYITGCGHKGKTFIDCIREVPSDGRSQAFRFTYLLKESIGDRQVFDIEVDNPDHLFVLANGMIVANSEVQFMTAKAGFLGKQIALSASRIQVTEEDCGAETNGILMSGDNSDVLGRVLAREVGDIPAGTAVEKKHLSKLRGEKIMSRSLATCQTRNGVCQKCSGHRGKGRFPEMGAYIGIDTGRLLSEPLTQAGLSSKHSGGIIKGKQFADEIGGFDEINQFLQVPKAFRGASVLAPADSVVQSITDAGQGGQYVIAGGTQMYVPRGRKIIVKKGDKVEAGDMLTDGTPNPAEMVKHKGIGEARNYFINKFGSILKDNDINVKQRHIETLSRSFFDRVRITDPDGVAGYTIDDIVTYSDMQRDYKPRADAEDRKPNGAVGMYLEKPTLHYSIGTKVTPKVAKFMKEQKVGQVSVHAASPGFEAQAVRVMDLPSTEKDFKTKLTGFGLKKSLLRDAQLGGVSRHDAAGYAGTLMNPSRL
jgi:intein/homing endonuclease